jgi:hypothetical protein
VSGFLTTRGTFPGRLIRGKYLRKLVEETTSGLDLLEATDHVKAHWANNRDGFMERYGNYRLY